MVTNLALQKRRRLGGKLTNGERTEAMRVFLDHFAKEANMTRAAAAAGVSRNTVYAWQEHDTDGFSERYHVAEAQANDAIDAEINRRAITGTLKPVYQGGKKVGCIREYSDVLLIFLAKARMPHKYRETTRLEHTGADGGPIEVADVRERLAARLAALAERRRASEADTEPKP